MTGPLPLKLRLAPRSLHQIKSVSGLAVSVIAAYGILVSPMLVYFWGPACRFEPSCSVYASQAVTEHGVRRGGWMTLKRLMRCRPMGGWGYDPVPGPHRPKETGSSDKELQHAVG